jgi:hypothetical protein
MDVQPEQTTSAQDVEMLARWFARLQAEVESRFEGVRTDFDVALLNQQAQFDRRFKRLEALIAEKVTGDLAEELLAELNS